MAMIKILILFLLANNSSPWEKLHNILEKEKNELEQFARIHQEKSNIKQAIILASEEKMKFFRLRDQAALRIKQYLKIIKNRKKLLKKYVVSFYKLSRSSWGDSLLSQVPKPGDVSKSMENIIIREYKEINLISSDLNQLEIRLKKLNKSLEHIDSMVEKLKLKQKDIETKIDQSRFKIEKIRKERSKYPRTMYDKNCWSFWKRISEINRKFYTTQTPFRQKKGVLVKPVPGVYLSNHTLNKGVYISAKPNSAVRAPEAGVIKFAGEIEGYGKSILIQHRDSYFSLLGRLDNITVKVNQEVSRAQILATAASLGKTPYVPVYYELRKGTRFLDPRIWLR
ncbi:MAG: peptidoglycan DD-metalloendopeptidase family protein [Deltaproteobacteria bacterium]|jgi:murein DD-endopeptidase MepM/ murein hydrolase activator NlpD|nr:peptidoglycan DD-metalloendopeptidase family protein [Deltaproteobacteria bacterium]